MFGLFEKKKEVSEEIAKEQYVSTSCYEPQISEPDSYLKKYEDQRELPEDLDVQFATSFNSIGGKFVFNERFTEMMDKLKIFLRRNGIESVYVNENFLIEKFQLNGFFDDFKQDHELRNGVGITLCEGLIADEGSILINSEIDKLRIKKRVPEQSFVMDLQIVIASSRNLKTDIEHALEEYQFRNPYQHPFLMDMKEDEWKLRKINNNFILKSKGTNNVLLMYCDEPLWYQI